MSKKTDELTSLHQEKAVLAGGCFWGIEEILRKIPVGDLNEKQKKTAEKVKEEVAKSGKWSKPIVTQIVPEKIFYSAEEYHQDYLQKHPEGYTCHYLRD